MNKVFNIVFEGNIGSGKTTMIESYKNMTNIEIIPEKVEFWKNIGNINLLELMYKDPIKHHFAFQTTVFLSQIYSITNGIGKVRLIERSPYSSFYIFIEQMKNKIPDYEFETLKSLFTYITEKPGLNFKPDLIVYIREKPEVSFKRMQKRNRPEEKDITLDFLSEIHKLHEDWLIQGKKPIPAPIIIIDGGQTKMQKALKRLKLKLAIAKNLPPQFLAPAQQTTEVLSEAPPPERDEEGDADEDDGDDHRRCRRERSGFLNE